jgi:hypothetical protein
MVVRLSTVHGRAGHSIANPQFERRTSARSEILRPAAAIAGFFVAAVVIGGLLRPVPFVSKEAISAAAVPVAAGDEATPDPAVPQADVQTGAINAATPLGAAGVPEPGTGASSKNKSSENPSDVSAASAAGLRLSSAVVVDPAAGSDEPKTATTAPVVTLEVTAAREPTVGEPQKRTKTAPFARRSFVSFWSGEPRAAVGQLPGKTRQRAVARGHRALSRRWRQRTHSRVLCTPRQLRRQRRSPHRWLVHAGLISVILRRMPRFNKWRRRPPPPAFQPERHVAAVDESFLRKSRVELNPDQH